MVSLVSDVSGLVATAMKEATVTQDIGIAIIKKSLDIEKVNGESALNLIASATPAVSSGGIDVYV